MQNKAISLPTLISEHHCNSPVIQMLMLLDNEWKIL